MTHLTNYKYDSATKHEGTPRKRRLSWMATTIILTNLGLVISVLWCFVKFGSFACALAYLAGDRLIPDSYARTFGSVRSGDIIEVHFHISNYANIPIRILGSSSTCTCVVAEELPLSIPPSEGHSLRVKVSSGSVLGTKWEKLKLFTDLPQQPTLVLAVKGRVVRTDGGNAF